MSQSPAVWSVINVNPEVAKCARKSFKEKKHILVQHETVVGKIVSEIEL